MTAPVPVLLARLEHWLEAARLDIETGHHDAAGLAVARAREIATQLRESI